MWNTPRAGTTAAALDGLKNRDGREIRVSNLDDFLCGRDEGQGERVEAALRERSISGKGEGI